MRKCRERDIEFDFSAARSVFEHDTTNPKCEGVSTPDGNTCWPGVDFRIEDSQRWIWLEVKDWRGRMRGSYKFKLKSKEFADEIRGKFLGTSAFLAWNSAFVCEPVLYILLFEPPKAQDAAMLSKFQDFIRSSLPIPRQLSISVYVWDLATWNAEYPQYQARKLY